MLPNDRVSLAGLPLPIHEGVRVLKEVNHETNWLHFSTNSNWLLISLSWLISWLTNRITWPNDSSYHVSSFSTCTFRWRRYKFSEKKTSTETPSPKVWKTLTWHRLRFYIRYIKQHQIKKKKKWFKFQIWIFGTFQAMLPNLPQYMIALLKILLAAAPTSKAKTDSINIMADVLPEEMPYVLILFSI